MILIDSTPSAVDIIDGGNSASPPTDTYDSMFLMTPQVPAPGITPTFMAVDSTEVINPGARQLLYVKIGGTSTTVTVVVPGTLPYTNAARDDLIQSGLSNTERVFNLPAALLTDPASEVITVSYSQTVGVTAALIAR